ncbi:sensor domain-containing protein [Mycobacterium sp. CBMA293]|uniref:PknH-like extracellular domain-containing protein n=2 Tax=Mycolicibacterium sp. CBMA 213 TaxID=1968788 RepID=A0A1S6GKH3_9MYCO|nr:MULTISPECIES: sensor domain-containing protein [unclassified Mycolicibacterium]AQS22369.1 hypothetical protein pCBMA213_2_00005 [Mycolicibacterium sp. CBMA 213]MUL48429.1 sensor domain-containing protein [Mycolicibacterium sp. CBMA 360]MUL62287.1 sensor domain-containing protein [Mycolicibacterium sp. CBMA 335]MUM14687.1 sensor domain-containing protein [Mycolicibacterium sp. CBMA 293]MUM31062.1 sensor domain-containing protein [Mycolicibacterium sp. CBMA 361]
MTTTAKTIRTITTRTSAAGRGTVVRLATAAVLASMAVTAAGGTAAAAPSAPLPTFTGYGNGNHDSTSGDTDNTNGGGGPTGSVLLSPKQVAAALGTGTLKEISTSSKLGDGAADVSPSSCISAYSPAESGAYKATPDTVAQNILADAKDETRISQAVVVMASKQDVAAQMKATVAQFKACAGVTLTAHEDGSDRKWALGDPELNADKTVLSIMQRSAEDGQSCERAVAGYRNAIIDVMACVTGSAHGQGVALANALSDQLSSQKA